jgi:hypothetical protein
MSHYDHRMESYFDKCLIITFYEGTIDAEQNFTIGYFSEQ